MVVGVKMVVKVFLLMTFASRMGMLVRIRPAVILQVIHKTLLKDYFELFQAFWWVSICHSLIINGEVLILTLSIFNAL